jgi:hypothetical protein
MMGCVVEFISDVANHQIYAPHDLAHPTAPKIPKFMKFIIKSSVPLAIENHQQQQRDI